MYSLVKTICRLHNKTTELLSLTICSGNVLNGISSDTDNLHFSIKSFPRDTCWKKKNLLEKVKKKTEGLRCLGSVLTLESFDKLPWLEAIQNAAVL